MARSYAEFTQHKAIVSWLRLCAPSVVFFHIPNGERRLPRDAAKLKCMGLMPGVPDLCCIDHWGTYFIEIKADKGKPSKEQRAFSDAVALLGVPVHIARNIDDVRDVLIGRGVALKEVLA